tara:strand:+ start:2168 stop:3973 length:1806 start_codon:yes stop_codon:yes gene_type:complete
MSNAPNKALLGVERSFMQSRWVMEDIPFDSIERYSRQHDLPEAVTRLLLARDIPPDQFQAFLYPTLKDNLPSPFFLTGMEDMADDVAKWIAEGKNFAIFGDFDVDGATSSATLYRFLKACGIDAPIYIPDRLTEGYGPNVEAMTKLKAGGADVIFILDCGSTAFDIIKQARALDLKIIVLDHHQTEQHLPDAHHVINPKRMDDSSGLDMLAACGVTFMACIAINNKLRVNKYYDAKHITEPNLIQLLDLIALGTVCDMVPLTGVNRLLVRSGFTQMQKTINTGLASLIEVSRIKTAVNTYHAGFVLGPRINAGSRVHKSDLGARLLSTEDREEAVNIAWILNDCNDRRKEIQAQMEREALEMVEEQGLDQQALIMLGHDNWHPGLSGLVAGKIKEKYNKPACIITYALNSDGTREGRGSGRSIPGINIGRAFMDAMEQGIIPKGGGHAMAGGFTVDPDKLQDFMAFMNDHVAKQAASNEINCETNIDGIMAVQGAKIDFVEQLENTVGPFGMDFPEPVFAFHNVRIYNPTIRGETHISVMISDWEGGSRMKAMAFGAVGTPLGDALLKDKTKAFNLIGQLKINEWQGRKSAELHIQDGSFA